MTNTLKVAGQVAGIGGVALVVFYFLFKDVIGLLTGLPPEQSYWLIILFMILVSSIAALSVVVYRSELSARHRQSTTSSPAIPTISVGAGAERTIVVQPSGSIKGNVIVIVNEYHIREAHILLLNPLESSETVPEGVEHPDRLRRQAEQRDASGQTSLGLTYAEGKEVSEGNKRAMESYLGVMYIWATESRKIMLRQRSGSKNPPTTVMQWHKTIWG